MPIHDNHHEAHDNLMLRVMESSILTPFDFQSEDDDKAVPLPLFEKRPINLAQKIKRRLSLTSGFSSQHSHTAPSPPNKLKKFMARHSTQDLALGSSPPTPTQAMIRISPSHSPSSITPTTALSNYTFPTNTTSPRKRTFTTTPSPRSARSPSLSFAPQVKPKTKLILPRQISTSISHLNPITSPRNSPPPDFLLDDDPFANLTGCGGGPTVSRQLSGMANGGDVRSPRSRLMNEDNNSGRGLERGSVAIGSSASMPAPIRTVTNPSRIAPTSPSRVTTTTPTSPTRATTTTPASPTRVTTTTPASPTRVATTTSRSTPTSPASKISGFGGLGMRSSYPSIDSFSKWSISQPQPPLPNPAPPVLRSPHQPSPSLSSSPQPNPPPLPHRPSPAHQRPAFKSRPSLPSLNTLAKMNFVPGGGFGVRKVRKGKVGARLPFEPWNDLGSGPNSSGETSPVLEEEGETGDVQEKNVSTPFPTLVSVMESASTSEHELNFECSPSPPPKPSSSSVSPQVHTHIVADMRPPSFSGVSTCQPLLQNPVMPSEVSTPEPSPEVVVYGYCDSDADSDRIGGGSEKLGSSLGSPQTMPQVLPFVPPPLPPFLPPQLMLQSTILKGDEMPPSTHIGLDIDPTSASSVGYDVTRVRDANPKETLEASLDCHNSNLVLATRHDVYAGGVGIVDDSDDDVDLFMDQFMEHYNVDREEDQRDDEARFGLQDQEEPGQEEGDDALLLARVDKRVVVDEDKDETQMQLSSRPVAAAATPLVDITDAGSLSSSETMSGVPASATLTSAFLNNSRALLAPTLRHGTRIRTTTTNVKLDNETDDSPLPHDSYTCPCPSLRQNAEMELGLDRLTSLSTPSVSDSTPPASATWSPSDSASVSRSRSFSSTYTTLSFGSESESSCPHSSVGDDETHANRYSNGIQHPPSQPSIVMKSPVDTVLHAEVSVLGSPPPLSRPFTGNEDISYIVSVSSPFSISPPLCGPETVKDGDTKTNDGSTTTSHHDVDRDDGNNGARIEDGAGEVAGESFDPHQLWVGEVLSQKRDEGIMRKKLEQAMEMDEDVDSEVGHEVEWEYIVGDKAITGSNGRLDVTFTGHVREEEEHAIAIVTPDAMPTEPDMTSAQHSPPSPATSLIMPSMTLSTSHTLLNGSSTAVAAALAMSSSSTAHKSGGSVSNVNIRTELSNAPPISSTPSLSSKLPIASGKGDNMFHESESEEDEEETEDEDEDEDEDDDHQDYEDDDIPLANCIPGALSAQRSIRQQVRQEREKKKQEKVLRHQAETTRTRLMTLRPGTSSSSSSQTNTYHQHPERQQQPRGSRQHTLTENSSISLNPFSAEDLAKKLRDINRLDGVDAATNSAPVSSTSLYQYQQRALLSRHGSKSLTRSLGDVYAVPVTEALPPIPRIGSPIPHPHRTKSIKDSSNHHHTHPSPSPIPSHHNRSLSRSRNSLERSSMTVQEPVPSIPDDRHKIFKSRSFSSRAGITKISGDDADRPLRATSHRLRQVPVPVPVLPSQIPPANPLPVGTSKSELVVQQRVFVGNMQRFNMVEIGVSTTAGDIIEMIEAEGSLKDFAGSGGWMVFEVAQDFGMERPIRSFELVGDVQASWNKDKMVNYFVLRMTPLDVPLNRSAIPSSSPTHSGYVEWEAKRGKWNKRFMQLREHSIWLSKRDNGQDQVHLCSLSNFDAYQVTRIHRAPKPFAFAIKSTDNLSFFENTADYLHSFACSEKDGKVWMEKILVARSYVLFQERHILFNSKTINGNAGGLSRSGTRKTAIQRPSHSDVFEPGSLLSKQL